MYKSAAVYLGVLNSDTERGKFLNSLQVTPVEQNMIEKMTTGQSRNSLWHAYRKNRLTASSFGSVCRARDSSKKRLAQRIVSPPYLGRVASVAYGNANEPAAIEKYQKITRNVVRPCGIYVDCKFGCLGASPDGIVVNDDDKIIEVKCPYSARDMTLRRAATAVPNFCLTLQNNVLRLKPTHHYYYQIQGQLHVSGKSYCDLVVYTPSDIHIETVTYSLRNWKKIQNKLLSFYLDYVLPELSSLSDSTED